MAQLDIVDWLHEAGKSPDSFEKLDGWCHPVMRHRQVDIVNAVYTCLIAASPPRQVLYEKIRTMEGDWAATTMEVGGGAVVQMIEAVKYIQDVFFP